MAAVSPAGPEPTMTTSSGSGILFLRRAETQRPAERTAGHEDSAQDQVRSPHLAGDHDQEAEERDGHEEQRDDHEEGDQQTEDDGAGPALRGLDRLFADGGDRLIQRVDG